MHIAHAQMPSNIALIKYMGKTDKATNRPSNASISLTLKGLETRVEIFENSSEQDSWTSLTGVAGFYELQLTEKGKAKFLNFFKLLKQAFRIPTDRFFEVRSANNFPSDCGLASSASSFAALTEATYNLARHLGCVGRVWTLEERATLSRQGSGSSCRSFFSPVCSWREDGALEAHGFGDLEEIVHSIVLVDQEKKEVSSSEAHVRVESSLLYSERSRRANVRFEELMSLVSDLQDENWKKLYDLVWAEFWDMHALFHTARPPFQYMASGTLEVLSEVQRHWLKFGSGPLVTMDAGANVHLIFRKKDLKYWPESWHTNIGAHPVLTTQLSLQ